jgi:3-oxoacyl-[acyl-carrier protein] reductase
MSADKHPQRVLLTGATGGMGRAIALACAQQAREQGTPLSLALAASRPSEALDALVAEVQALGARATGLCADLTDAAACRALVAQAEAFCGDLTALVSNAGASGPARLADMDVARWDQTFALNTRATFVLAQAARAGLARSRGSVVAIASMSGLHPHPGYGAYSAAKAALVMLCRQMAQEWAAEGIRANAVCPGMIRTPLTEPVYQEADTKARREALVPAGRIGTAQDVAQAVLYLSSPGASYVTGQALVVDGGLADHMLAMIPGRPGK